MSKIQSIIHPAQLAGTVIVEKQCRNGYMVRIPTLAKEVGEGSVIFQHGVRHLVSGILQEIPKVLRYN